ncbi:MAG: KpsF/GutQ family sugar-phosphate isomerase, partial [bacterium]|nr:KpsF/GutQ family sugar-phosphate isomerase [bacterium]
METEARELDRAAGRLDERLVEAVELILDGAGKVVLTGVGKSGHVGRKIAATLSSTGTPAVFLHPSEASHGDLGLCAPGDLVIMISNSGTSTELARLVAPLKELGCPLIGILGKPESPLAAEMDVVLDASVEREADPDNLVPTASVVVALALGHALAVALIEARNFSADEFGQRHPGGQLGRNLRVKVGEAMHSGDEVAWVAPEDSLKQVVIEMTRCPLGAACVVEESGRLAGLITDGDLRRALRAHDDIRQLRAADVMTRHPVSISGEVRLIDAMRQMEKRPSAISLLPVVDEAG